MSNNNKKNYGWLGFAPLLAFLIVYLGSGLMFTALGYGAQSFKQIPRVFGLVVALLVVMCMGGKERSMEYRMDTFCKGMANDGTMIMVGVFLLSGAFSQVCTDIGARVSTANLGLSLVPPQFLLAGIFLISAFIATAMGTSMGTISAIGPIAVTVAEGAGLNMAFAIGAVLGGAMFGDNLSVISDTTIAATRGCGCEMRDKFKMNGAIAAVSAILAIIVFTVVSDSAPLTGDFPYQVILSVPYLFVLIFALTGVNVFILLLGGIIVAGVIGLVVVPEFTVIQFAQSVTNGMAGMYEISMVSILMRGCGKIAEELGGVDWMVGKMTSQVKSRKGAEYMTAAMVSVFDLCLANNTIAILMSAPLVRPMAAEHNIAPKRMASLLDIFSCVVQGFIPHGGQVLLCMTLTGLNPFPIMGANFYCMILAVVSIVTIQFGLGRTKEEKEGIPMYDENQEVIALNK
ncbi:MAG: Na+/H+ antiporter NhaC family protein [Oscillibacter sp.]|nr:Na+/H+ antiporter NhaC family protein [Oscillibacter sp.]